MRDGPFRRTIKTAALACFVFDHGVARLLRRIRGERVYRLAGRCERSGQCCEAPSVRASVWVWYLPSLRRLFLRWQRAVNGFELVNTDAAARVFVFRCGHFDPVSRRCDSYDSRPGMCRDYPRVQLTQPNPDLFPGCGYRLVAPNADALRRALEERGLSEEQLERLRRDLHLGP
jgi:Fe-S-cluster containining protein